METFLRKYNWALNLVMIAAGALLMALLVNGVIASFMAEWTVPQMPSFEERAESDRSAHTQQEERDQWIDTLGGRCLFGCPDEEEIDECPEGCADGEICENGECVPEEPVVDEQPGMDVPRATELPLKLTGVLEARNPRWSMAMILHEENGETHVAGVGDLLPGDEPVEVLEIRRDRVFIDRDGELEFIRLEDSPYGDPQPVDPRRRAQQEDERRERARQRPDRGGEEDDEEQESEERSGVVQNSDTEFTVDREAVEKQLEDPEALAREARVMPNYRDGEPNGLRLVGVRPDSFYSELGIQSGDVLHSVNGNAIENQRQALEVLEAMGEPGEVSIEVERRGERREMNYQIR